jgi:hypothetical protein
LKLSFIKPVILLISSLIPTSYKLIFTGGGETLFALGNIKLLQYVVPICKLLEKIHTMVLVGCSMNSTPAPHELWDTSRRVFAEKNVVRISDKRANIMSIACSHSDILYTLITADNTETQESCTPSKSLNFIVLWIFNR